MTTGIDDWAFEQIDVALWDQLKKAAWTALRTAQLIDSKKRDDRMRELITMLEALIQLIEVVKNGRTIR